MNVYASLVIASLNKARKAKVVFPLPKVNLEELSDPKAGGTFLLNKITDIEAFDGMKGWVVVKFSDLLFDKENNELFLMYGCVLPYEVFLTDGYSWKEVEEIQADKTVTKTAKQIIMETGVRI